MDDDVSVDSGAHAPATRATTVLVILRGPIGDHEVPAWCARVESLLADGRAEHITCDVADLGGPAGAVIDALSRLQLAARRSGGSIRLRRADASLQELLGIIGFAEVLPVCEGLAGELQGDAEQREEPVVDEGVEPDDPGG